MLFPLDLSPDRTPMFGLRDTVCIGAERHRSLQDSTDDTYLRTSTTEFRQRCREMPFHQRYLILLYLDSCYASGVHTAPAVEVWRIIRCRELRLVRVTRDKGYTCLAAPGSKPALHFLHKGIIPCRCYSWPKSCILEHAPYVSDQEPAQRP